MTGIDEDFKIGDRVAAIVCGGQLQYECLILDIKRRPFRKKYLVEYTVVLEFRGTNSPISGRESYKKSATEWVNKVWNFNPQATKDEEK